MFDPFQINLKNLNSCLEFIKVEEALAMFHSAMLLTKITVKGKRKTIQLKSILGMFKPLWSTTQKPNLQL
jgi:hypothetical protein